MHRYEVDMRGLTLAEAEAKTREMIDEAQQEELELYELALRNIGADPADFSAVARLRAEHVRLREAAIVKWRAMVARVGKVCSRLDGPTTNYFFIVVVIRYETTATARWTLMFVVHAFINYAITVAVWTRFSFHVRTLSVVLFHGRYSSQAPWVTLHLR